MNSATLMFAMFFETDQFNGNISSWDMSSVTNMDSIFYSLSSNDLMLTLFHVDRLIGPHTAMSLVGEDLRLCLNGGINKRVPNVFRFLFFGPRKRWTETLIDDISKRKCMGNPMMTSMSTRKTMRMGELHPPALLTFARTDRASGERKRK